MKTFVSNSGPHNSNLRAPILNSTLTPTAPTTTPTFSPTPGIIQVSGFRRLVSWTAGGEVTLDAALSIDLPDVE